MVLKLYLNFRGNNREFKKILLICTISLVTVSAMLVSCGKRENTENFNDKKIESIREERKKTMTKIKK